MPPQELETSVLYNGMEFIALGAAHGPEKPNGMALGDQNEEIQMLTNFSPPDGYNVVSMDMEQFEQIVEHVIGGFKWGAWGIVVVQSQKEHPYKFASFLSGSFGSWGGGGTLNKTDSETVRHCGLDTVSNLSTVSDLNEATSCSSFSVIDKNDRLLFYRQRSHEPGKPEPFL